MDYLHILTKIDLFLVQFFHKHRESAYYFHNISHIYDVVHAVGEIADFYKLAPEHHFILKSAAYFHDIGYIAEGPNGHERKSVEIARTFFAPFSLPAHTLGSIENCIMATRDKQHPTTFLEAILCDADLMHLACDKFEELNSKMYTEIVSLRNLEFDKRVWIAISLNFLERHNFHTDYVRSTYHAGKEKNIKALKKKLAHSPL